MSTSQHYIPGDTSLHSHHHEDLNSYMKKSHGARSYEHDICFNTGFDRQLKIALWKAVKERHTSIT